MSITEKVRFLTKEFDINQNWFVRLEILKSLENQADIFCAEHMEEFSSAYGVLYNPLNGRWEVSVS